MAGFVLARAAQQAWSGGVPWAGRGGLLGLLRSRRDTVVSAARIDTEAPPRPAVAATPSGGATHAALQDALWGEGFLIPGGEAEVTRLAGLLPLSAAHTLLLLGRDGGGGARSIARARDTWIAHHQHDPAVRARATVLLKPLGRRALVGSWDPAAPAFRPAYHGHALALEPLRAVAGDPTPLLTAIARSLKPGGQLVLTELVEGPAAGRHGRMIDRWRALDSRAAAPTTEAVLLQALHAAGFVPFVTEDAGERARVDIVGGWSAALGSLRAAAPRGTEAAGLVAEAECWLLRDRLLETGALRLLRWHAALTRAAPG